MLFTLPPKRRGRLPDWEQRLFTFLQSCRQKTLAYGAFDCACGLAAGAVEAQTGETIGLAHLGKYDNHLAARRYMRNCGWDTFESMADSFLRRARDHHRGNVLLIESNLGQAFAIRTGVDAVAFGETGLQPYRIPANTLEWSAV